MPHVGAVRPAPSQPHFMYQPLVDPLNEFRLLQYVSSAGDDMSFIMVTYNMEHPAPTYLAISYYWGSAKATKHITVNGYQFFVPETAETALRQVRQHGLSHCVWLDAICIDQANDAERGHQVRSMPRIYSRAACVAASLGSSPILEPLQAIKYEIYCREDKVMAVNKLAELPYFSRMWIIQELKLANRVYLISDRFCVTASEFLQLLNTVGYYRLSAANVRRNRETSYRDRLDMLASEILWREDYSEYAEIGYEFIKAPGLSLAEAVAKYSGGACLDPRDQVYSLIGIAEDRSVHYLGSHAVDIGRSIDLSPFPINYCKSTEDVLLDFVHYLSYADEAGVAVRAINKLLDYLMIDWADTKIEQRIRAEIECIKRQAQRPLALLLHWKLHIVEKNQVGPTFQVEDIARNTEHLSHVSRNLTPVSYEQSIYNNEETILFDRLWVSADDLESCTALTPLVRHSEPLLEPCHLRIGRTSPSSKHHGKELSAVLENVQPQYHSAEVLIHSLDILLVLFKQRGLLPNLDPDLCTGDSFLYLTEVTAKQSEAMAKVKKWERASDVKPPWLGDQLSVTWSGLPSPYETGGKVREIRMVQASHHW